MPELERREDELEPARDSERREGEERGGGPEVVEPAAREEPHPRLEPDEVLPEAELLGERHVVDVAREEVVVEALERRSAHVDDAHEAAGLGVLLEDRDGDARPEQAIRRDEAGEAAADHGDPGRIGHHPFECKPGAGTALCYLETVP